ncbi:hypothetical protein [Streptomyces sp. NPDC005423]|uniref:hypothetical protein n=1 Tax=Streptomyces sp. NPDC005423 TaxID=3155343 RepID=UPI0033ACABEA
MRRRQALTMLGGTVLAGAVGATGNAGRDGTPSGPDVLTIHHDNLRIASSYALAEPADWS